MKHAAVQTIILDRNEQPFASFEMAAKMRDLLMNETNQHYQVELFDAGNQAVGFMVTRHANNEITAPSRIQEDDSYGSSQENSEITGSKPGLGAENQTKVYHPALRSYFLHIPLILVGAILVLFAVEVWLFALSLLGMKGIPVWVNGGMMVNITQMMGNALLLWLLTGVLINYYGTSLTLDAQGISYRRGILTQDITQIRFQEIRTIGLRQGIFDRLLNIGILEFASSGTNQMDIRIINIGNPTRIKVEIEELIERHNVR